MSGQDAVDLFRGAGGWSVACQDLGIDEVGVECMPETNATASAAGHKTHEISDVWDFLESRPAPTRGRIASPPCQTFSAAGKGTGRRALDSVLWLIQEGIYRTVAGLRAAEGMLGDPRTGGVRAPRHHVYASRAILQVTS